MKTKMRPTISTLAIMALILAIVPARNAFAVAEVGQPAPALVVQELDGQTFDLSALRGKVVVINFWATWCQPCRQEMPALDAFYRRYRGQGLEMIGLSADRPHERSDVSKVMQAFSYPAAMLDDVKVDEFGDPSALPVTFIVDVNGEVRAKFTPDRTLATEKSLSAAVLPLLPGKPTAQASSVLAYTAQPP
jgi:cytochrome c biogenesis protein CcmG, thiol:disulfide interchange protein DsbE